MIGPGEIDLTARNWNDIAGDFVGTEPKGTLLIGNGLSRAIWDDFSYESLLDRATDEELPQHLSEAQKQIFNGLGTPNFETVLQTLHDAIVAANALGVDATAFQDNYQAIRSALVAAVKAVHVPWVWVSEVARAAIGTEMRRHATVYSMNYDLLPYWGMTASGVGNFVDYFFASAGRDSFDAIWLPDPAGRTRVFFPHGALHLVRRWSGVASKLKNHGRQLLEQFGAEPQSTPLFVSEGTADDKRKAIRRSDYLSFAYKELAHDQGPFVLFGVGLGPQDEHIAEAINRSGVMIAVGLHGEDPHDLEVKAAGYVPQLDRATLVFYKSSTHPLGDPGLRAGTPEEIETDEDEIEADYEHMYEELFGEDW
jgi:hypothetical protein